MLLCSGKDGNEQMSDDAVFMSCPALLPTGFFVCTQQISYTTLQLVIYRALQAGCPRQMVDRRVPFKEWIQLL